MKKILKLTVMVSAMALVVCSCIKDRDAKLVNKWKSEKLEYLDVTFKSGVSAPEQAFYRALLQEAFEKEELDLGIATFEFFKDGSVTLRAEEGEGQGTYTATDGVLSITIDGETLKGKYTISKNTLHWDVDLLSILRFENQGNAPKPEIKSLLEISNSPGGGGAPTPELPITSLIFRWTFTKQ